MTIDTKPRDGSNGPASTRVHEAVDSAAERIASIKESARDRIGAALEDLAARMARHPIATVAIGIGAGYLLARIRARR